MKKDGTIAIKGKNTTIHGSAKVSVKADDGVVLKVSKILPNQLGPSTSCPTT